MTHEINFPVTDGIVAPKRYVHVLDPGTWYGKRVNITLCVWQKMYLI